MDTIHLYKPLTHTEYRTLSNFIETTTNNLVTIESNRGISKMSNIANFRLNLSQQGLTLQGSLTKLKQGYNYYNTNFTEISEAIGILQDTLSLDLSTAKLNRMDIAYNSFTEHKPREYYPLLSNSPYFTDITRLSHSITYKNSLKEKQFYDKIEEGRKNYKKGDTNARLPQDLNGKNILRFEMRYLKEITKQFKKEINLSNLQDKDFFRKLVISLKQEYYKINKLNADNMRNNLTASELNAWMFNYLIEEAGGISKLQEGLKMLKGRSTAKELNRAKTQMFNLVQKKNNETHHLIKELDLHMGQMEDVLLQ